VLLRLFFSGDGSFELFTDVTFKLVEIMIDRCRPGEYQGSVAAYSHRPAHRSAVSLMANQSDYEVPCHQPSDELGVAGKYPNPAIGQGEYDLLNFVVKDRILWRSNR
jgi:hypothetical protein